MPDIVNVTPPTRILTFDSLSDYSTWESSEEYSDYAICLVNNGVNGNPPSVTPYERDMYVTDIYYGHRRASDIIVVDAAPDTSDSYPDNKIYLVPYSDEIWVISGQAATPKGYQMYLKFRGVVTPLFNSIVSAVIYDGVTGQIAIRFNTNDGPVDIPIPALVWKPI